MKNDVPAIPGNVLLRLSEKADGRRGIAQTIVRIRRGDSVEYDVLTAAEIDARRAAGDSVEELIPVEARHIVSSRREREGETIVTITTPGKGARTRSYKASEVDAVFLSESAVQKFVLPYYARSFDIPQYEELLKRYSLPTEVAWGIIHYPPSMYDVIGDE